MFVLDKKWESIFKRLAAGVGITGLSYCRLLQVSFADASLKCEFKIVRPLTVRSQSSNGIQCLKLGPSFIKITRHTDHFPLGLPGWLKYRPCLTLHLSSPDRSLSILLCKYLGRWYSKRQNLKYITAKDRNEDSWLGTSWIEDYLVHETLTKHRAWRIPIPLLDFPMFLPLLAGNRHLARWAHIRILSSAFGNTAVGEHNSLARLRIQ